MHFPIHTEFYNGRTLVKVNHSIYPNSAVENAIKFLAVDMYSCNIAQVLDSVTGEVHAEIIVKKSGKIEVSYLRDPRQYERRIRLDVLFKEELKG